MGRDADLGAQAKLAAVSEARAGVGVHGRGIDRIQEALASIRVLGNDGLGVHRAVAVDVCDGLVLVCHDLHAHLERQVLATPVLLSRGDVVVALGKPGVGACGARGLVAVNEHAVVVQYSNDRRQKRIGHSTVDQQRLGGIAHAYALGLGINDNVERLIKVGGFMHVDVAVARARLDHRHKRLAHAALDQACTSARNEYVDNTAELHELAGGLAVGGLDHRHGLAREALGLERIGQQLRNHGTRVIGQRAAAQNAGVAGADADARGVGRHVGARLVDHSDQAQRHAHTGQVHAACKHAVVEHAADGIGQLGELLQAGGHALDALGRQPQAIEQSGRGARIARSGHIELVGSDDGVDTVAQCCGHGAHGLLALLVARRGKRGRRCLGGNGKIVDIRGYIDRHGRPFLLEVCNHGSRFAHGLARGGRIGQPETPQRTEDSHGPHHFVPRPQPLRRGPQHRRPP